MSARKKLSGIGLPVSGVGGSPDLSTVQINFWMKSVQKMKIAAIKNIVSRYTMKNEPSVPRTNADRPDVTSIVGMKENGFRPM